jgi:hypothetical protein
MQDFEFRLSSFPFPAESNELTGNEKPETGNLEFCIS